MAHLSNFPPVYPGLEKTPELTYRTPQIKLLHADVRTIISISGNNSIITHLCQHAIRNVAQHITNNDWTLANYDEFLIYLRERSASATPPPKGTASDVAGRVARARKPAQKPTR